MLLKRFPWLTTPFEGKGCRHSGCPSRALGVHEPQRGGKFLFGTQSAFSVRSLEAEGGGARPKHLGSDFPRLANAVPLLKDTSLSIKEVANQVGFSDQSYFDRRFKSTFDRTPRSFRLKFANGENSIKSSKTVLDN